MRLVYVRLALVPLCCVLLLVTTGCQSPGQPNRCPCQDGSSCPTKAEKFPASWAGQWQGTCIATRPDGRTHDFAMQLHINPTDDAHRWSWQLVYGTGEQQQTRDYALEVIDRDAGHYRIDEQNSILIDGYLTGDTFWSQYSLEGTLLTVSYRCAADALWFELTSFELDNPQPTGGAEEIPVVLSYPLQVTQRATLTRS